MRTFLKLTICGIIYSLIFQFFYNWMKWLTPWPYTHIQDFLRTTGLNLIPFMSLVWLLGFIVLFITSAFRIVWVKLALDVLITTGILIVINFTFTLITGSNVEWGGSVFNALFILMGTETYYYVQKYQQSIKKEAYAREEALKYKYEALKAQIDPHFLFNSLNILNSLMEVEPEKSKNFLVCLSRLYRYIMAREDAGSVIVEEELSFLRYYIEILEIRYSGQLEVKIEQSDPTLLKKLIIPYTLQLLMENVCKHNIISSRHPMTVIITIKKGGITFSNPIVPKRAETVSRIGLKYLNNLYGLYGKVFSINRENDVFTVFVPYIN